MDRTVSKVQDPKYRRLHGFYLLYVRDIWQDPRVGVHAPGSPSTTKAMIFVAGSLDDAISLGEFRIEPTKTMVMVVIGMVYFCINRGF